MNDDDDPLDCFLKSSGPPIATADCGKRSRQSSMCYLAENQMTNATFSPEKIRRPNQRPQRLNLLEQGEKYSILSPLLKQKSFTGSNQQDIIQAGISKNEQQRHSSQFSECDKAKQSNKAFTSQDVRMSSPDSQSRPLSVAVAAPARAGADQNCENKNNSEEFIRVQTEFSKRHQRFQKFQDISTQINDDAVPDLRKSSSQWRVAPEYP